jgi:hypothetical protein
MGVHDARTNVYTQTFAEVSTGAGANSANVTLSLPPWADAITSVTSASSNITSDSPTAADYNAISRILTVGGLASASTRTLSISYDIASLSLDGLSGINAFLLLILIIVVLSVLAIIGRAFYEFLLH